MIQDGFSEDKIREQCPHCDLGSFALKHPLEETSNFWVACDVHPLTEGHILIIPKQHLSCVGEFSEELFNEFVILYDKFTKFLKEQYGSVSTFEHGKIGQTVFHSHMHLLPYDGSLSSIIPEGEDRLTAIGDMFELKKIFSKEEQYLFFSIGDKLWTVDTGIAAPRFFRDRFAKALNKPERGNWKEMHNNRKTMFQVKKEISRLKKKWKVYCRN